MTIADLALAVLLIGLLLLCGKLIRYWLKPLRKLYLPSSIVAGVIGLLLGPQVFGALVARFSDEAMAFDDGLWPEPVREVWASLPGILISVVFAGLFLGKTIPGFRAIWKRAGPMVAHGQTMAWGQYVVGITLAVVLLVPVWSIDPMSGALIEIGFEGGHGTAAGLAGTFRELGFESGADLALGLATVGVVMGVLLGTGLINWGVWRGHIDPPDHGGDAAEEKDLSEHESREEEEEVPRGLREKATDPMSIHIGLVALAIGIGWLLLEGLVRLESALLVPLGWPELMTHIPLFPLAMIGGVIVQVAAMRTGMDAPINRAQINRISNTALDVLIVAALSTLSLAAIGEYIWAFLILAVAGVAWNLFGFLVLAPRMFPENWVQNGLANFGQGIGMTVVGLLLVRMADPSGKTKAMEAFGYKQLLFEPVVGGGIFTAASLPLIAEFGAVPVLIGVSVLMVGWLVFGLIVFRPERSSGGD